MLLKNKTAIVTGSSRGIGRSIAIGMADAGANIIINYNSGRNEAYDTLNEIKKMKKNAIVCNADISSKKQVISMVDEAVKNFGCIDILVNNSAIVPSNDLIINIDDQDWKRAFEVNINGCFYCTQVVANHMIKNKIKGKIINISSICAALGYKRRGHYSATKGAMEAFTRACAIEFGQYKINVNAVSPGATWTDINKELWTKEEVDFINSRIPLERIAVPQDMVGAVIFLASDMSDYITGQVIRVDGGWTSNN